MLRVKLQTHLIETTVSAKTEQSPSTTCETGKLTCDADRRDDSLLHLTSSYQSDAVLDRCPLKTYRINFELFASFAKNIVSLPSVQDGELKRFNFTTLPSSCTDRCLVA